LCRVSLCVLVLPSQLGRAENVCASLARSQGCDRRKPLCARSNRDALARSLASLRRPRGTVDDARARFCGGLARCSRGARGLALWTRPEGAAPLACAAAVRRRRTGTCARVDSAPSRKGEAAARGARCGGGLARCSPRCPRACFCGPQARCGAAPTTTCVRRRRAPPPCLGGRALRVDSAAPCAVRGRWPRTVGVVAL